MRSGEDIEYNIVLYIVSINLNVLCTLMKSGLANDQDSILIITLHEYWKRG